MGFVVVFLALWLLYAFFAKNNPDLFLPPREPVEKTVKFTFFTFYWQKNVLRAYIYIGLELMIKDRGELKNQQSLFLTLLSQKFTKKFDRRQITKTYLTIIRFLKLVDLDSVFAWISKHSSKDEKLQLVELICELAYHNDVVTASEMKFIYLVASKIDVSIEDVRAALSIRQERLNAKYAHQNRTTESSDAIKTRQKLHVLGLSGKPNLEQIKKAYRDLAKQFHPDRYHNAGELEKKQAHDRFVAIYQAYEFLMQRI